MATMFDLERPNYAWLQMRGKGRVLHRSAMLLRRVSYECIALATMRLILADAQNVPTLLFCLYIFSVIKLRYPDAYSVSAKGSAYPLAFCDISWDTAYGLFEGQAWLHSCTGRNIPKGSLHSISCYVNNKHVLPVVMWKITANRSQFAQLCPRL